MEEDKYVFTRCPKCSWTPTVIRDSPLSFRLICSTGCPTVAEPDHYMDMDDAVQRWNAKFPSEMISEKPGLIKVEKAGFFEFKDDGHVSPQAVKYLEFKDFKFGIPRDRILERAAAMIALTPDGPELDKSDHYGISPTCAERIAALQKEVDRLKALTCDCGDSQKEMVCIDCQMDSDIILERKIENLTAQVEVLKEANKASTICLTHTDEFGNDSCVACKIEEEEEDEDEKQEWSWSLAQKKIIDRAEEAERALVVLGCSFRGGHWVRPCSIVVAFGAEKDTCNLNPDPNCENCGGSGWKKIGEPVIIVDPAQEMAKAWVRR